MKLFIRIVNGQPFEHPITEDNFREAFPHIDTNNLPSEFAQFTRVVRPDLGVYEVNEGVSYQYIDGMYTDVHHIRPMTDAEKAEKIVRMTESVQQTLNSLKNIALEELSNASDANKPHWQLWLDALNAWVLVDVLDPKFPAPPHVDSNGNVFAVTAPGSAPNVIG